MHSVITQPLHRLKLHTVSIIQILAVDEMCEAGLLKKIVASAGIRTRDLRISRLSTNCTNGQRFRSSVLM